MEVKTMKITKEEKALYVKCIKYLRYNYSTAQLRNPKNVEELVFVLRKRFPEIYSADDFISILALAKMKWVVKGDEGLTIIVNGNYEDYTYEELDEVSSYV